MVKQWLHASLGCLPMLALLGLQCGNILNIILGLQGMTDFDPFCDLMQHDGVPGLKVAQPFNWYPAVSFSSSLSTTGEA